MWLLEWKEPVPPLVYTGGCLLQSVEQDLFMPEEELTFINCKQSLTEKHTYGLVSSQRFCQCWSTGKRIGKLPLAKTAKFCPSWPRVAVSPITVRNLKSHLTKSEFCCYDCVHHIVTLARNCMSLCHFLSGCILSKVVRCRHDLMYITPPLKGNWLSHCIQLYSQGMQMFLEPWKKKIIFWP